MNATRLSGVRLPECISEPKPIVSVVDDDISVRGSLEPLIALEGWQPEVFACAEEFLARPPVAVPNCVVLDIGLPDISGLEVQRLLAHRLAMPIIFVAGYANAPTIVHAMKAGAVEFLTKPIAFDALFSAIRHALAHSRAVLDHQAEIMPLRERYASLSRRECEVMRLIVCGQLNKQVGASLGITEITVKAHRAKVMRKMQAPSLAALVTMAGKLGIASGAPLSAQLPRQDADRNDSCICEARRLAAWMSRRAAANVSGHFDCAHCSRFAIGGVRHSPSRGTAERRRAS